MHPKVFYSNPISLGMIYNPSYTFYSFFRMQEKALVDVMRWFGE